jgi:hypothetical protein
VVLDDVEFSPLPVPEATSSYLMIGCIALLGFEEETGLSGGSTLKRTDATVLLCKLH